MPSENFPENLRYNKDYSWVKLEGDTAVLGVIKPAADRVKEFVFIKLPKKGQAVKAGEVYASVEAVKWSGHLSSPFTGEIIEVHDELFDDPAIINRNPYGEGWIAKIRLAKPEEKDGLLSAQEAGERFRERK